MINTMNTCFTSRNAMGQCESHYSDCCAWIQQSIMVITPILSLVVECSYRAPTTPEPLQPQDPFAPIAQFRSTSCMASVATVRSGLEKSNHGVLQGFWDSSHKCISEYW